MTGVEMIKLLKKNGIKHFKVKGSHYHYILTENCFKFPIIIKKWAKALKKLY